MFRFNNMLILKITHDCNLRCEYCYIKNKDNFKGEMITFDTYKQTIRRIAKDRLIQRTNDEKILIVFHGGEPTLASKEFFMKMLLFAEDHFVKNGIRYSFAMQSNLTLIDKGYAEIFSKFSVGVGVSFDGIGDGNKKRTKTIKEQAFYKKFDLLKEYNIDFGVLMVAHDENKEHLLESVDFLRDNFGIDSVKINFIEDVVGVGGEIPGLEFFEKARKPFLDEFFEKFELRENNLQIEVIKFITDYVITKKTNLSTGNCGIKVCGGGIKLIEMEANGDFSFCGRYSEAFPEVRIENVFDDDPFSMHQIKRYVDFISLKHKVILKTGCDTCIAAGVCDHGCMAFHYSKFGEWGTRTDLVCELFKPLYEYLVKNVDKLIFAMFRRSQREGKAEIYLTEEIKEIKVGISRIMEQKYGLVLTIDEDKPFALIVTDRTFVSKLNKKKENEITKIRIDNIVNIRENKEKE